MDCSSPGSSIHGIFQARVLEWGAIAFSAEVPGLAKAEGPALAQAEGPGLALADMSALAAREVPRLAKAEGPARSGSTRLNSSHSRKSRMPSSA